MGNYQKAEPFYIEAKEIEAKVLGKEHPDYATSCNNLAGLYYNMGNYQKAESLYVEAKVIREKVLGKEHTDYATSCNNLAGLYDNMGNYQKAEPLYIEAKAIREKVLGKEHPYYATGCNNLALLYINIGNYSKAELLYIEAKEIEAKTLGREHPDYATNCNNLAELYRITGNYQKAEPLYIEAKAIREKVLGKNHSDYATSCNNLAELYRITGNYQKAETLYIEAKTIREKLLGKEHSDYARSCNNLALLYNNMGDYSKAEPLYIEAKTIREKVSGKEHPDDATSCNNLAALYNNIGNYSKAEPLYIEAKAIREKVLGKEHPDYATSCNNLAALYNNIGNYSKAEALYIEAKAIREKVLGKEHPDYATSCNNLAALYYDIENYEKTEPLYLEAKVIREKVLGKEHPDYATSCNNLAGLYYNMGNYKKAEPLYIEAKEIWGKVLGKEHPDYASSCISLALLYSNMCNYQKAEVLYIEALYITNSNITKNFQFLSEKEKELYFNTVSFYFKAFNSFALKRKAESPSITEYVYNNTIRNKGLLLKSSTAMRSAILSSKDTALINTYSKWINLEKEITKLHSIPIAERDKNPEELEKQANILEKQLVKSSQLFFDLKNTQNMNWKDVQKTLKLNEVAIEFVHFNYYNKNWTDTTYYCALIITPESKYPEMIPLFEEKQLIQIIGKFGGNNYNYINSIYGKNIEGNNELYNLIWKPMEESLKGAKKIYLSPDGLLHKISFSAISKKNNIYLSDIYSIERKTTTAKIVESSNIKLNNSFLETATLFGGIVYNTENTQTQIWNYLDGTNTETERIDSILKEGELNVNYFSNSIATEGKFKEIASRSNILHIATHGFFYPDLKEKYKTEENNIDTNNIVFRGGDKGVGVLSFVYNTNPLMRSGLVFAGANDVWNLQDKNNSIDDGVLTAQEVVQIDMRKTKLVVMSACETGLGDIKGSEGVYGLQRAFKMAGVNYMIMSLWQVPDKETEEFMTKFYKKLIIQKDIKQAFAETQKEMRVNYDPYFWAAFVLIE